jgi:hypothetical protein
MQVDLDMNSNAILNAGNIFMSEGSTISLPSTATFDTLTTGTLNADYVYIGGVLVTLNDGGVITSLPINSLEEVNASTPVANDIMRFDGVNWIVAQDGVNSVPLDGSTAMTGTLTATQIDMVGAGTVDGRDISVDGAQLDQNTIDIGLLGGGSYVLLAGDTMTGNLDISAADIITSSITHNTRLGVGTLDSGTGSYNTAIGTNSQFSMGAGSKNTSLASQSLSANIAGAENTALGYRALNASTANDNTAVGSEAGAMITSGTSNTAIGMDALTTATVTSNSTAVGKGALTLSTGENNTAFGTLAATTLGVGDNNTAIGRQAMQNSTTGTNNLAVGTNAGRSMEGTTNIATQLCQ